MAIPEGTKVQNVKLEDFVPHKSIWDNSEGRVTVVGDAAHAIAVYALNLALIRLKKVLMRNSPRRMRRSRHH